MGGRIVALLPMKRHSERLHGKNFRLFGGKPLCRWMLDTLLSVPEVSQVVINTDARDLLAEHSISDAQRVLVRDRRPEICGDFVSMNLVIADDLRNVPADVYLMTHVTNPLLRRATIQQALRVFEEARAAGRADSLFAVNRFQSRFYQADMTPVNHDPGNLLRTQDLDPLYEENSTLYIFTGESFAATGARIGRLPMFFETPRLESIDIDNWESWEIAEMIARISSQLDNCLVEESLA